MGERCNGAWSLLWRQIIGDDGCGLMIALDVVARTTHHPASIPRIILLSSRVQSLVTPLIVRHQCVHDAVLGK